ncbi:MAG: MoxR family ATPase [Bacteroidota bacterium]
MKPLEYPGKKYEGKALMESQGDLMPYFPDPGLIQAVEIARFLRRPLLIRGEPGCGKTRLAEALAYEMYGDAYKNHYFKWSIRSTSKAREGIYTFDSLERLQDIQDDTKTPKPPKTNYRHWGPLGDAYTSSTEENPSILLIDEIDKADIDFPNDLLDELEWTKGKMIEVFETEEKYEIHYPPIVIITSNNERELPNAFLRRCVFYFIQFPGDALLMEIGSAYAKTLENNPLERDAIKEIIDEFLDERKKMDGKAVSVKKPSTSELLDWIYTHAYYLLHGGLEEQKAEKLRFPGVLLKTETDFIASQGDDPSKM